MSYTNLPIEKARTYCETIFQKHGFTPEESRGITDVVLTADLYGIESHGIQRMIRYHNSIVKGLVDPKAKPVTVFETPVSAVIDGNHTMGQVRPPEPQWNWQSVKRRSMDLERSL